MIPGGIVHWIPVVVVSVLAVPLAAVFAATLVRRRVARGANPIEAARRSWAEVGIVAGTVPWVWMILTPLSAPRSVRLVPLMDLLQLLTGPPLVAFFQVVGNLLVFAAYGFLAPIRWRIPALTAVVTAGMASAAVKSAQYLFDLGRVSSVDDVLLNAAGAGLAALCSRPWWAGRTARTPVPIGLPHSRTDRIPGPPDPAVAPSE